MWKSRNVESRVGFWGVWVWVWVLDVRKSTSVEVGRIWFRVWGLDAEKSTKVEEVRVCL